MEYVRELINKGEVPEMSELTKIDKRGLRRVMSLVKPGRSSGADQIDGYSLKVAYPLIEDSILHLVNLSISEMVFAKKWKPLTITPHHKKGSRALVKNYRPVCNL